MNFDIEKIKRQIQELIENNYYKEAINFLSVLIEEVPEEIEFYSMYVVSLTMKGNIKKAIDIAKKGLAIDLRNFDLLYNLAYLYNINNEFSKALTMYTDALLYCNDIETRESIKEIISNLECENNIVKSKKLVIFSKPGMDNFLNDIIKGLDSEFICIKILVNDNKAIDFGMEWADVCWFEWCDELVAYGSKHHLAREKSIICRLHRYEAFSNYINNTKWENIDKVIFVSEHIRDIVRKKVSLPESKCEVIFNGINLKEFQFNKKSKGFNLAWIGYLNLRKNPMLVIQYLNELVKIDKRYKLFIAGSFQDEALQYYLEEIILKLGLEQNVQFDGFISNDKMNKWLKDKHYIVTGSIAEGHPVGIMEAMASGLKPVMHYFPGSELFYPENYIYKDLSEFINIIREESYNPKEYRDFIEENYSLEKQINKILNLIKNINALNKELANVNYKEDLMKDFAINVDDLENTEALFEYLINNGNEKEYMKLIGDWFIKSKYDLTFRFNYYYSNMYRKFKSYSRFRYINIACYKEMHNLSNGFAKKYNISSIDNKKDKIILFSNGLDIEQTVNKFVINLAKEKVDEFDISIISTLPQEEFNNYEKSIKELENNNIEYFIPESLDILKRTEEILKYIVEISPKYAIYQSFYLAPTSILLLESLRKMGIKIGAFILQQPEVYFHEKIDFIVSFGFNYNELKVKNDFRIYIPIEHEEIENSLNIRKDLMIENDKFIISSIGRSIKYNDNVFWNYVCKCSKLLDNICFVFFGASYNDYAKWVDRDLVDAKKIIFVDFNLNAKRYLKSCDAYINSPISGGVALSEAYYAGLPIITTYSREKINENSFTNEISMIYPQRFLSDNDIYPDSNDYEKLFEFTKKLVENKDFSKEIFKLNKINKEELTYEYYVKGLINFLRENF